MTRIDFHTNIADKIAYVCRLVRKARATDAQITVRTANKADLVKLDEALWAFSEVDFLPHVQADDPLAATTPVILTDGDDGMPSHHQILINLSPQTPVHFARFERMFEIISTDDADVAAGRARYRFYQQRGYPLTHFVAKNT